MEVLFGIIYKMLQSKKAVVWVSSGVAVVLGYLVSLFGLDLEPEIAMKLANSFALSIIALASSYMVGQGAADFGKEAKKEGANASVSESKNPLEALSSLDPDIIFSIAESALKKRSGEKSSEEKK